MKFLHDRRRAGVLALLGTLTGAAALFLGGGGAGASHCHPQPSATGNVNLEVPGVVELGVDQDNFATTTNGVYWCVWTPQGGGAHLAGSAHLQDANTATPGGQVDFTPACTDTTSCPAGLDRTGVEVNPTTNTNAPLNPTTAGTGGSAGLGAGTCTYVDGAAPTCPFGFTVGGVTVNESDASVPTTHTNSGGCVTVPGNPCVTTAPDGFGVGVLKGDPVNPTIDASLAGGAVRVTRDLGGCVGFNAGTGC